MAALSRAVELAPQEALFHNNCAYAFEAANHFSEAEHHYREAIRLKPVYGDAWFNLGNLLMKQRHLVEAEASFEHAAHINPQDGGYWNNLGNARLLQKKYIEAEIAYRRALENRESSAWNNLGNALRGQERAEDAIQAFRQAVTTNPAHAEAWLNLGNSLLDTEQNQAAAEAYQRAIALAPEKTGAHCGLGEAWLSLGKTQLACESFERALQITPLAGEAWLGWVRSRRITQTDEPDIARLKHLLQSNSPDVNDRTDMNFALGMAYDWLGQYEEAFCHFREANQLMRERTHFDRDAFAARIDHLIALYRAESFVDLASANAQSERPVIIVGMPRSGTTLVEQILSSHPQIAAGGERRFWEQQERLGVGELSIPDPASLQAVAEAYLADLATVSPSALRVTDKMPDNFLRLGLIHRALPHARIIHCRRNPVDICLSLYFQKFVWGHAYSYDLEDLAYYYQQYERLMAHWRKVLPPGILTEVQYEALVNAQEQQSRRLIEFCGLAWDNACMEFHASERSVNTASNWQVRQPIYTRSVERWRNYASWIPSLLSLLDEATPCQTATVKGT